MWGAVMQISLIGGKGRLYRHYQHEAERLGIELRIFSRWLTSLRSWNIRKRWWYLPARCPTAHGSRSWGSRNRGTSRCSSRTIAASAR